LVDKSKRIDHKRFPNVTESVEAQNISGVYTPIAKMHLNTFNRVLVTLKNTINQSECFNYINFQSIVRQTPTKWHQVLERQAHDHFLSPCCVSSGYFIPFLLRTEYDSGLS